MFDNNKKIVLCVVVLFSAYLIDRLFIHTGESTVLEVKHGKLRGKISLSRTGREFYEFLGIPYAEPPVGKLRFMSPKPAKPWTGIRDATNYQSKCMQVDLVTNIKGGSEENCLVLNVFSPKTTGVQSLLPVVVFIHGGYFMMGDSKMYGPKYFMDEDVVLVTLNYRLGSLGFLNAGNKYARGNQGLKDQVLALKWVKENIFYFSGDPNRVTLFGHSSGAVSAHLHMLSKMSSGLFHRVIASSGTANSPMTLQTSPMAQAKRLGKKLRCPSNRKPEAMVACIGQAEVQRLVESHREVVHFLHNPIGAYKPTIENLNDEEAFLTEDPEKLLMKGEIVNKVPMLMGLTRNEGYALASALTRNSSMLNAYEENWKDSIKNTLLMNTEKSDVLRKIRSFYFGNNDEPFATKANIQKFSDMFSDRFYTNPIFKTAKSYSKDNEVYFYQFSQPAPVSLAEIFGKQWGLLPQVVEIGIYLGYRWVRDIFISTTSPEKEVAHFDDQTFFFNMPFMPEYNPGNENYEFSRDLIKLWVNFAAEGKPGSLNEVQWKPTSEQKETDSIAVMELSKKPSLQVKPIPKGVKFWDSLNLQ